MPENSDRGHNRNYKNSHRKHPVVDETSAGGLIVAPIDGVACVAVIARRNRLGNIEWCLPKGHLEEGETPQDAAVREVSEETGIFGNIITHLASIDYWFAGSGRRIHKVVHHFLLEAKTFDLTVENDPDQEAEDAAWVPLATVATRLAYPNERRVVAIARKLLDLGD
ncbi:NUDIX hydrolase [Actinomycetaceae bacterium TAE3-ERU4]|nr:NUDIX hydrolase [Actinomycetaceae bacterium TAE3-ERU4]